MPKLAPSIPRPQPKVTILPLGVLTMCYLALPLLIFFAGWLKPLFAILAVVSLFFCVGQIRREWPAGAVSFLSRDIFLVVLFSFALTAFVGIGGFTPEKPDWVKHNAVLYDCVNLPWPVVLQYGPTRWTLDYYLAWYLPAAVVGKLGGYAAAQIALWIWSSLGVTLCCLWFSWLSRIPAALAAPAFFAFAGLDFAGNILVQIPHWSRSNHHLNFNPDEFWARIWQLTSHYSALSWVPGQALAGWLSTAMLLGSPAPLRPACFILLFTCVLLWSPFAGLGMAVLAFFLFGREWLGAPIKSRAAILLSIVPISVLISFYGAKISPDIGARFPKIPITWFFQFQSSPGILAAVCLMPLFGILEFGLFLWFIRAGFPKGTLEHKMAGACGLTFICLLPVTMGYYNDLFMRASFAPMFCLAVLVARTATSTGLNRRLRRCFLLLLLVASLTPLCQAAHQGYHILQRMPDSWVVPHQVSALVHMPDDSFGYFGAQYVGTTNAFFSRHLAKDNAAKNGDFVITPLAHHKD